MDARSSQKGSKEALFQRMMMLPAIAAGVVLIALMLLTVSDVFLRALFKKPIIGVHEISVSMMICIGFLGLAWVTLRDRHIKVDLLVSRFSPAWQKRINYINYLLVGCVSAVMTLESYQRSLFMRKVGAASERLNIPQFPFYLVIAVGYFLLLLTIIVWLLTREVQKK
jgi:TRAP-type C4-dicarboxylate transport system permease small subunit